jgi:cbb3-type cytochrome oxidase maturation protein
MEVVFILLPLAVAVAGVMLALFVWAVKSGQFDDLHTPALRILIDDEPVVDQKHDAAHSKERS